MAITQGISPDFYNYSKSPVIARLATNRLIVTPGTYAQVILNFSSTGVTAGQSIVFVFNGQGVSMVFASSLGDSGLKLRTNVSSLSLSAFVAQVAADLRTNYDLLQNFTITAGAASITIKAKEKGSDWTCICFSTATGIAVASSTAGIDEVLNENFRIRMDLYVESSYNSNTFEKVASEELEPFGGAADFDLSELLHACFTKPDLPLWQQTTLTRCAHSLKRYYITYTERYGLAVENHRTDTSNIFHIYRGGVSAQEFPLIQPILQSWIWPNGKFLTWHPNDKEVTTFGQEYLYWMVGQGIIGPGFDVQLFVSYSDATTSQVTLFTRSTASIFEMYCIPAGYDQLGVGLLDPSKEVVYYEIWVRDSTTGNPDLSEKRRYYPIYRALYESRQFCFSNSLAGMEMLTVTGEIITGILTEDLVAGRKLGYSYNVVDGDTFKVYAEKQDTFKVSTGHISKAKADALDEIFLAEYIYVSDPVKSRWLPVIINKGSIEKYKTGADLYAINFEYTLAYFNRVIEGDISAPNLAPNQVTTSATTSTLMTSSLQPILLNNNYPQ